MLNPDTMVGMSMIRSELCSPKLGTRKLTEEGSLERKVSPTHMTIGLQGTGAEKELSA